MFTPASIFTSTLTTGVGSEFKEEGWRQRSHLAAVRRPRLASRHVPQRGGRGAATARGRPHTFSHSSVPVRAALPPTSPVPRHYERQLASFWYCLFACLPAANLHPAHNHPAYRPLMPMHMPSPQVLARPDRPGGAGSARGLGASRRGPGAVRGTRAAASRPVRRLLPCAGGRDGRVERRARSWVAAEGAVRGGRSVCFVDRRGSGGGDLGGRPKGGSGSLDLLIWADVPKGGAVP